MRGVCFLPSSLWIQHGLARITAALVPRLDTSAENGHNRGVGCSVPDGDAFTAISWMRASWGQVFHE